MSLATRCPWCETVFRLTKEQAAVRAGLARCGICNHTFNALDYLVRASELGAQGERLLAASPQLLDPLVEQAYEDSLGSVRDHAADDSSPLPPAKAEDSAIVPPVQDEDVGHKKEADVAMENFSMPSFMRSQGDDERGPRSLAVRLGWATLSLVAFLILCGQLLYYWRGDLLIRFPGAYAPVAQACQMLGCSIVPPHDIEMISIESSALEPVPNAHDVMTFSTLLRNNSPVAERYPDLELTLTDAQDKPEVRRVLTPADYLSSAQRKLINQGLAANSELPVKVEFEISGMPVAGYRAGVFYP